MKYGKLVAVVRVLQNTQNLVISRCCLAEDGYEMYKDFTCVATVLRKHKHKHNKFLG